MKQVLIKQGQIIVEEVPAPKVKPGTLLVQVINSCISSGTEISNIKVTEMPLWKKALKQPENVKKAFKMAANQGLSLTQNFIKGKVSVEQPTGYSAAGVVIEIGEGVNDIRPGDRVACAGAQYAHHSEIICVPRNLVVPVPDNLDFPSASTVTLGSIALQGVRRLNPTLGETFVVIGLGILGQIAVQILKASGCRVIGLDLDKERISLAKGLGLDTGIHPEGGNNIEQVIRLTDGNGADGVIITASTPSDEVVSSAFQMCRKKGRVVLVGDVGLNLKRRDFYAKELDFFISTSYGPGRYDPNYEETGLDYPIAYVRWTENRNMREYLQLLVEKKIKIRPLIAATYSLSEAAIAYESLKHGTDKSPIILLSYSKSLEDELVRKIVNPSITAKGNEKIRIGIIGAGNFAKFMHLPNLKKLSNLYHLEAIMSQRGYDAVTTSKQFGAEYSTTDYRQILNDSNVDAVIITTRHNLHTSLALEALKSGKHVLVEKPLCLTKNELQKIEDFYSSNQLKKPILLTGFNRRFSQFARRIHEITEKRNNPMIINYRMNAGYIPLDNWVHTEEGGGRNIGEACHIYDLFTYLTESEVIKVEVQAIKPCTGYYSYRDNFVTTMTFKDGSLATLTYTALGATNYSKEQMTVFVDGKVLALDDYKKLTIFGARLKGIKSRIINKGHKEELENFAQVIQKGGNWPIPLWQQVQTMDIAFKIEDYLKYKK